MSIRRPAGELPTAPHAVAPHAVAPHRATTASWRWLCASAAGVATPGAPVRFRSAAEAERWLERNVVTLTQAGVAEASLVDGEHIVYGPLALTFDARC